MTKKYFKDYIGGSLTSNLLITLQDAVDYIASTTSDSLKSVSVSGYINNLIQEKSTLFESYVENPIAEQSFVGYYNGMGNDTTLLHCFPITSLSAVNYRIEETSSYNQNLMPNVVLDGVGNPISTFKIQLFGGISFPYGIGNVEVKYNAGFKVVPEDIQEITKEAVFDSLRKSGQKEGIIGISTLNKSGQVGNVTSYKDISEDHKKVLNRYRRIR